MMKRYKKWLAIGAMAMLLGGFAPVGTPAASAKGGLPAAFKGKLYPPKQIMRHADDIELTDAQRATIKAAIKATQAKNLDLQFKLQEEVAILTKMISSSNIDQKDALAQADRVMDLEQQIKRNHLILLITIKNALSPAQKEKLTELILATPG